MGLRLVSTQKEPRVNANDPLSALAVDAARGNTKALHALLLSVTPMMLRGARGVLGADHSDIEDVVQEAAVGLVDALKTFRRECTVLHFATRIAVLAALAARRKLQTGAAMHEELRPQLVDDVPAEERALASLRRNALRELCRDLPEAQSEALIMHCVLGFTIEEVADACTVPANTVRSRLRLAKEALRARVQADPILRETLETIP